MKINKNEAIQNFVKAQQELVDILRRTNNIISVKIGTHFAFFQGMVAVVKDYLNHHIIIKAKELADAIQLSEEFKEKDMEKLQSLIIECNQIITETTKINYGAVCRPRSRCCG